MKTQIPKMGSSNQYYFPEYPGHNLDGMMCWGAGKFEGEFNGLKCRKVAYGMGINGAPFFITPEMFNSERVLVKQWLAGQGTIDKFYLIK